MNPPPFQRHLRVLSMRQPWASLLACRMKMNETRSWTSNYRGLVAIHASQSMSALEKTIAVGRRFIDALNRAGIARIDDLPLGAIIAVGCLEAITPTNNFMIDPTSMEYAFGDYSPDRYAWHFNDMRALPEPIRGVKGSLSLWTLDEALHTQILIASGHAVTQQPQQSTTPVQTRRDQFEFEPPLDTAYLTGRLKKP